jgi:hypothetical protein
VKVSQVISAMTLRLFFYPAKVPLSENKNPPQIAAGDSGDGERRQNIRKGNIFWAKVPLN